MGRGRATFAKVAAVLALALAFAAVGGGIASLESEHYHHAAVELLDDGRRLTVRDVELHLDTWRGTTSVDAVRVSFPVGGRAVTTELIAGRESIDEDDRFPDGWQRAFDGSFYEPPLDILVAPGDVDVAMAVDDAELYRTSTLAEDLAISAGLVAAAVGLLVAAYGRRPRGRGGPGGRHRA